MPVWAKGANTLFELLLTTVDDARGGRLWKRCYGEAHALVLVAIGTKKWRARGIAVMLFALQTLKP